jgi:hypothetical protein
MKSDYNYYDSNSNYYYMITPSSPKTDMAGPVFKHEPLPEPASTVSVSISDGEIDLLKVVFA